jgi:hemerythrin-like metal-binding protein
VDNAFEWNERYSVKVSALDAHHKQLFAIIQELYIAMRAGRGKTVAGDVLRRLIDYTIKHFAEEEKLMEKYGYPQLVQHQVEHKALVDKVVSFKRDFDAGGASITPELMTFLQKWLTEHIQEVDQGYSDFLNAKGVR